MPRSLHRRVFLELLGGSTVAVLAPGACSSRGADPAARSGSGGAGVTGAAGAAGEVSEAGTPADAAPVLDACASGNDAETRADAPPECIDPRADASGCAAAPLGRAVGRPCDFAELRIHVAPHEDMFLAALVGRDAAGLYARAAVCTHQGCNLAQPEAMVPIGIACPCHGSLFDHHGQVLPDQPAKGDLRPVAIALGCDGQLHVDLDTTVSADFRLAV